MQKKQLIITAITLFLVVTALSACAAATPVALRVTSTAPIDKSPSLDQSPSPTPQSSPTPANTPTLKIISQQDLFDQMKVEQTVCAEDKKPHKEETSTPTAQVTPILQEIPITVTLPAGLAYISTPLAPAKDIIGMETINQLQWVGQWGKGELRAVAFSPDGHSFAAGSQFGIALYDRTAPGSSPKWIPFPAEMVYSDLYFSGNGQFLLLETQDKSSIFDLASGHFIQATGMTDWVKPNSSGDGNSEFSVYSPDGKHQFNGQFTLIEPGYNKNRRSEEATVRQITDTSTGSTFNLKDEDIYFKYSDRSQPEGCDLTVFSPCGNALQDIVSSPYRAAFSPDNQTLAVLYSPPSEGPSYRKWYSTLRVYKAQEGSLLYMFGDLQHPVTGFAYSPDGRELLVGFLDGSIQIWDLLSGQMSFSAHHFSPPMGYVAFSRDGRFVITLSWHSIDIRSAVDGSRVAQYAADGFALSPTEDLVALSFPDGSIDIRKIEDSAVVQHIEAHKGPIYALAFSNDGQTLTSSGEDCAIKAWDVHSGKFIHLFEKTVVDPYEFGDGFGSRIFIYDMQFIPGKDQVIGFGSWGTMVSWKMNSGATQYFVKSQALEYYGGMVTIKPHFPTGFSLHLAENSFQINEKSYNLDTGAPLESLPGPEEYPKGCAPGGPVTQDQKIIFSRGYNSDPKSYEGSICVLDAQDKHLIRTIPVLNELDFLNEQVVWPYLSPDGKQLIVPTSGGAIMVYQVQ
jgi:WD40 repeat protein